MISAKAQKVFTVQEYLDWEKSQDERFEFHDGMIVSMAGGTPPHALICENIFGNLYSLLKLPVTLSLNRTISQGSIEAATHDGVSGAMRRGQESIA